MTHLIRFRLTLPLEPAQTAAVVELDRQWRQHLADFQADEDWFLALPPAHQGQVAHLADEAQFGTGIRVEDHEGELLIRDLAGQAHPDFVVAFLQAAQARLCVDEPWGLTYSRGYETAEGETLQGGGFIAVRGERVVRQDAEEALLAAEGALALSPTPKHAYEAREPSDLEKRRAMTWSARLLKPLLQAQGPAVLHAAQAVLEAQTGAIVAVVPLRVDALGITGRTVGLQEAHEGLMRTVSKYQDRFDEAITDAVDLAQLEMPEGAYGVTKDLITPEP